MEKTAHNFKAAREYLKLTQVQASKMFDVSRGAIGNWEVGIAPPPLKVIQALCSMTNVRIDDFLSKYLTKDDFLDTPHAQAAAALSKVQEPPVQYSSGIEWQLSSLERRLLELKEGLDGLSGQVSAVQSLLSDMQALVSELVERGKGSE